MRKNQGVAISGVKSIQEILEEIAPKYSRNLMRSTVHGIAGTIAKDARKNVPVDSGLAKSAIKTRRRRSRPDKPVSEVYVVRSGGKDAFYWRFVEYGTQTQQERQFFRPAFERAKANLDEIMLEQFGKKLENLLKRARTKSK